LRGLTIAVGNRRNRILLYQFLAAEIRALHCSYGVGVEESYKKALTFLENCERYTLRSLVRRSAKQHWRHFQTECVRIDDEIKLGRLLDRNVSLMPVILPP